MLVFVNSAYKWVFGVVFQPYYRKKMEKKPWTGLQIRFANSKTACKTSTCLVSKEVRRSNGADRVVFPEETSLKKTQKAVKKNQEYHGNLQIRKNMNINEAYHQIEFTVEMHFFCCFLLDYDKINWKIAIFTTKLMMHARGGPKTP